MTLAGEGSASKVLIAGIADGLGSAVAGTFSKAGFDIVGLSRSNRATSLVRKIVEENGRTYTHVAADVSDPVATGSEIGPHANDIEVLVYNAHTLIRGPFSETSLEDFEQAWRVGCLGAAVLAQAVLAGMKSRGRGTIIITGATASIRGGTNFAAFSSAKFALRGLSQSLAREYGPLGVHVSHVLLDGLIDEPQTTDRFGRSTESAQRMDPEAIAALYSTLHTQSPSAWTHELDLRPFAETF